MISNGRQKKSPHTHKEVKIGTRTEGALAFLDTWSIINDDGLIQTTVYHKETHTDQCLHFNSNHPLEHKRGVVKTLMHRVDTIVSDERDKVGEKSHVKQALNTRMATHFCILQKRNYNYSEFLVMYM